MLLKIDSIKVNDRLREVNEDKVTEIAASIKEIGLLNPITISENNELIAGNHRLQAFKMLGFKEIPVNVVSLSGLKQELAEIDENLIRHDLHVVDRGDHFKRRKEIYELLYPTTKAGSSEMMKEIRRGADSAVREPSFVEDTSKKTGVSSRVIHEEIQISRNLSPEIKKQVKEADLSKTDILKVARMQPEKQRQVMDRVIEHKEAPKEALKKIHNEELQEIRKQKQITPSLPENNKYNVIYADPPWDIGSFVLDKWESPLEEKYPTMSLDDLKKIDINSLKDENCVLFMWSTLTTIPDAIELMKSWGFKYHIMLTWDKGNGWSSTGFHRKTEVILVGYVGKITEVVNQFGNYIPTVFYEAKKEHSKKPEIMYNYLISNTKGKRLEMFARDKKEGFDCWGNEV